MYSDSVFKYFALYANKYSTGRSVALRPVACLYVVCDLFDHHLTSIDDIDTTLEVLRISYLTACEVIY